MNANGDNDNESEISPPWQEQILPFINLLDEKSIELPWMTGNLPPWVKKAMQEVLKAIFPEAKLKEAPHWTPREVGAILGKMLGTFEWMGDENGFAKSQLASLMEKADSKLKDAQSKEAKAEEEKFSAKITAYADAFSEALPQILAVTGSADPDSQREFFAAYTAGLTRGKQGLDVGTYGTTATPIYIFLVMNWRALKSLPSIPALHKICGRELGEARVGNLRRFEQLCKRIGLKLRSRGRPKKAQ